MALTRVEHRVEKRGGGRIGHTKLSISLAKIMAPETHARASDALLNLRCSATVVPLQRFPTVRESLVAAKAWPRRDQIGWELFEPVSSYLRFRLVCLRTLHVELVRDDVGVFEEL